MFTKSRRHKGLKESMFTKSRRHKGRCFAVCVKIKMSRCYEMKSKGRRRYKRGRYKGVDVYHNNLVFCVCSKSTFTNFNLTVNWRVESV